jgi:hypothetical protein
LLFELLLLGEEGLTFWLDFRFASGERAFGGEGKLEVLFLALG